MSGAIKRSILALTLFAGATLNTTYASDWVYHTVSGDTLWDLCLEHTNKRGCWLELAKYNNVSNDRAIPVGSEIRIPLKWLKDTPVVGHVVTVSGDVTYQPYTTVPPTALSNDQKLLLGARIVSNEGSAKLEFNGGNTLMLRANSTLELNTMSGPAAKRSVTELGLPAGAVEVSVIPNKKSRFIITTPAAIASVRGTEYRVNSHGQSGEEMRSEVISGSVGVASDKAEELVPAGFGVTAKKGMAPSAPRKLLPAPTFESDYSGVASPATVKWEDMNGAVSWQFDLMEGTSDTLLESYPTTATNLVLADLSEGCYTIKLRAIDSEGFNGLDSVSPLCVVKSPTPVANISEVVGDEENNTLYVSWSAAADAERYRVELSTDSNFSELVETQSTTSTNVTFEQPMDKNYSIRVIAIDRFGNESVSNNATSKFRPKPEFPWPFVAIVFTAILL